MPPRPSNSSARGAPSNKTKNNRHYQQSQPQSHQPHHQQQQQQPHHQQQQQQQQQPTRAPPTHRHPQHEPTSLLVVQNLAVSVTEQNLRDEFVLNTYKNDKARRIPIEVTSIRMLNRNGHFTGVAFVGFKTVEQATNVLKYWNRAFLGKMRVTIEYASVSGASSTPGAAPSNTTPQTWSKHSEKSILNESKVKQLESQSLRRQEVAAALLTGKKPPPPPPQPPAAVASGHGQHADGKYLFSAQTNDHQQQRRKQKILQVLSLHPALYGLDDEQRLKVINDPKFHDYIGGVLKKVTNSGKLWDNDDTSNQTNVLRALAMAMEDPTAVGTTPSNTSATSTTTPTPAVAQGKSSESYETLLTRMKAHKDNFKGDASTRNADGSGSNVSGGGGDDDDDDYFDNPGLDTTDNVVSEILQDGGLSNRNKATSTKHTMTDSDFLKMAMGGFSDDDDDDDDDNDNNGNNTKDNDNNQMEDDEDQDAEQDEADGEEEAIASDKGKKRAKHESVEGEEADGDDELVQLPTEDPHAIIRDSGYLFIRNLPFTTAESDLMALFGEYGEVSEVSLPLDSQGQTKGYARVFFVIPEEAVAAYDRLSRTIFQGRILHILPGRSEMLSRNVNDLSNYGDDELAEMTHKRKKEMMLKATAASNYNWNSLFISQDTIANAVSQKFGMKKTDLLGGDVAGDHHSAAVRMAIAETHMIAETKAFLEEHGVLLDKFSSSPNSAQARAQKKSNRVILVKNLPFAATEQELRKMFTRFGNLGRLILPPYKTLALVEYTNPMSAKSAFLQTSYKNFHNSPLYLEWAPDGCLADSSETGNKGGIVSITDDKKDDLLSQTQATDENDINNLQSRTIFVKNLNFDTTDEALQAHFAGLLAKAYKLYVAEQSTQTQAFQQEQWRVRNARTVKRTVTSTTGIDKNKTIGDVLSLGYGFLELSHPQAAVYLVKSITQQHGTTLDNHLLSIRICQKSDQSQLSSAMLITKEDLKKKTILREKGLLSEEKLHQQAAWSRNNNKIIVRNIPFEANVKEIRETFQSFGQVKRCTLPKKVGTNQTRGFAFVEFVTPIEAQKAVEALRHTHIFGRHLVLEWAKPDETIEELREKAAASSSGNAKRK